MSIKFKLDKNSLIQFYSQNSISTKSFTKVKLFFSLYILIILLFGCLLTKDNTIRSGLIFGGIGSIIFSNKILKHAYRSFHTILFNKDGSTYMFQEMNVDIKDDNLYVINSIEERYIYFNSITGINIADDYLIIVLSKIKYLTIPLSAFIDMNEKNKFISLLEDKTNKPVIYSYPNI